MSFGLDCEYQVEINQRLMRDVILPRAERRAREDGELRAMRSTHQSNINGHRFSWAVISRWFGARAASRPLTTDGPAR